MTESKTLIGDGRIAKPDERAFHESIATRSDVILGKLLSTLKNGSNAAPRQGGEKATSAEESE